jgi:cysteine dioxygenase
LGKLGDSVFSIVWCPLAFLAKTRKDHSKNIIKQNFILKTRYRKNKSITTLAELVSVLRVKDRREYAAVLKEMKISPQEFEKYATWSDTCYTRNCIEENSDFELILICWSKAQKTAIHDHGGEECWVYVVDGEYRENIYEKNDLGELKSVKSLQMQSGDVTYMIDFMGFHDLENHSNRKAMSLHLYANPIKKCNVYDADKKVFVSKKLFYNTTE